jgi:hypothetical protein
VTVEEAGRIVREDPVMVALGPLGRKKISDWLAEAVVIEGAGLRIKTTLGGWLRLVKEATENGWEAKSGIHEVDAEGAKAFAAALAKAGAGSPHWRLLVVAARVIGRAGRFEVRPQETDLQTCVLR